MSGNLTFQKGRNTTPIRRFRNQFGEPGQKLGAHATQGLGMDGSIKNRWQWFYGSATRERTIHLRFQTIMKSADFIRMKLKDRAKL